MKSGDQTGNYRGISLLCLQYTSTVYKMKREEGGYLGKDRERGSR